MQDSIRASAHYVTGDAKITTSRQETTMRRGGGGGVLTPGRAPPDLPSLLLDARIVYIGMPLVASVTELVISELLWLNYNQPEKPVYIYLNSIGSQQNMESVGFETEAYAILDTMQVGGVCGVLASVCEAALRVRLAALSSLLRPPSPDSPVHPPRDVHAGDRRRVWQRVHAAGGWQEGRPRIAAARDNEDGPSAPESLLRAHY